MDFIKEYSIENNSLNDLQNDLNEIDWLLNNIRYEEQINDEYYKEHRIVLYNKSDMNLILYITLCMNIYMNCINYMNYMNYMKI